MAIIPPAEFIDELKDDSATNRWDVMVSYSEKQLNDLLAVRWKHSMKPVPLKFEIGTPIDRKSRLVQTFDIELGEPSLQFVTAGGKATLSFPIEGGWKSKMIGQGKQDWEHEMDDVTITEKSYAIDISIPVIHLFAKESTISGPEVEPGGNKAEEPSRAIVGSGTEIHFEEDKVGSTCITFQFDNEKIDAEIRNTTGKPLDDDALMLKTKDNIVNGLVTYVLDKEHVKWIHYSIAVVTNKVDPADKWSDFLRPTSCMFNTQPGALNVFIKTKGGTAGSGMSPPLFQHRSTRDILPFPAGYDSSIIISRRLFVEDFLLPNLKTFLKSLHSGRPIEVKKPTSGTGMELNLRLDQNQTFNYYDLKPGWGATLFSVQDFTTDFDVNPVTVVIDKGADGITPEAKWHWKFTSTIVWDLDTSAGGSSNIGGKTTVTATMPGAPRPFATISDDTLDIRLAFRDPTDQPKLSFTAEYRKRPWWMHREMVKYIPEQLRKLSVRLTPFEMTFPKLDFFATQNVFAPGTRFMTATQVLFPHDIVLAGKMVVEPAAAGGGVAAGGGYAETAVVESAPATTELLTERSLDYSAYTYMPAAAEAAQGLKELLDRLYTDNRFLGDAMAVADDGDGEAVLDWFHEQGYQIARDGVKKQLEDLTLPGPNFDVRFAGGVYKLTDESLGFEELLVHSVTRKVYIDGQETVASETNGTNGNLLVTVTDGDGREHHLKLEFVAKDRLITGLTGSTWPSDAPDKTSPVSGEIFFPWDDKHSTGSGRRDMSPAEKHWEREANEYYAVGLDLVSPMHVPPLPPNDAAAVTERFFTPVMLMALPELPTITPAMCRDIVALIEWPFTAPYRAYKFLQGVRKRKKNKVLDRYGDKTKLLIAEEPLPEEVLDQFHEAVERNVNEAMEVPGYRDEKPEKIRGFIERSLREELVRTLTGLSRRELAEQLKALEGARGLQTKTLIDEAINSRLETDIDKKNYEPYLDSCIARRQAELKYEDAAKDVEKFQETIKRAQQEYEDHATEIRKKKTELESVRKDLEERPSEPESREKRVKELEEEVNKIVEKQKEAEERRAEAEEKKGEKEKERDKESEDKKKREKEVEFHKKRWLREHEKR